MKYDGSNLAAVLSAHKAFLYGANGTRADLCDADLCDADLRDANLRDADLCDADLRDANLRGANLCGANLRDAKLTDLQKSRLSILPAGELIVWKACCGGVMVKLRIPADAKRSNATGRKCRAEFADVLEVIGSEVGRSKNPSGDGVVIEYKQGARVRADCWDDNRWKECSHGIHFYLTKEEAEAD